MPPLPALQPRASVSDTNVWQLAVFAERRGNIAERPPTERSPFFGIAVSSMTSTASLPPTQAVGLNEQFCLQWPPHPRRHQR